MKNTIIIEYTAYKMKDYDKAFKPSVYVNGKWIYTISRARKTMKGALNKAKELAEQRAQVYPKDYNDIQIKEKI